MIRLDKPNEVSQALLNRGGAATRQDCDAYVRAPAAYDSGKKFEFIKSIYRSTRTKEILKRLQHKKCCYCESMPSATSALRIDHFRPKRAVRQSKGSDRLYPGYYWLAYRWDNLVLACDHCNLKKSDYFPLEVPGQRARNHLDPLDREAPLLLNPYGETNPGEYLTFDGAACRPETERGRVTVTVLGLNRPELQEERQYVLNMLAGLCAIVSDPHGSDTRWREAREAMDSFARPEARYSAMARDYLSVIKPKTERRSHRLSITCVWLRTWWSRVCSGFRAAIMDHRVDR